MPGRGAHSFGALAILRDPLMPLPHVTSMLDGVLIPCHQVWIDRLSYGCNSHFVHTFWMRLPRQPGKTIFMVPLIMCCKYTKNSPYHRNTEGKFASRATWVFPIRGKNSSHIWEKLIEFIRQNARQARIYIVLSVSMGFMPKFFWFNLMLHAQPLWELISVLDQYRPLFKFAIVRSSSKPPAASFICVH